MDQLLDPSVWVALVTLAVLEIVLGVDNVIFISILSGKLPKAQQDRARLTGLTLAGSLRILLLLAIAWIVGLTAPLFVLFGQELSGRDLILTGGGLFLLAKATSEIHELLEGGDVHAGVAPKASFAAVIAQILALDIVFSL